MRYLAFALTLLIGSTAYAEKLLIIENGKAYLFENGVSEEIAAKVVILGDTPDDPTPDPDDPSPEPNPSTLQDKVKKAAEKVPPKFRDKSKAIARVYETVSSEAAANPGSWDPAALVNEAKVRNTAELSIADLVGWAQFFLELAQILKDLKLDPTDLDAHIAAFKAIAEALNSVR